MSVLVGGAADAAAGTDVMGTGIFVRDAPGKNIPVPIKLIGRTDPTGSDSANHILLISDPGMSIEEAVSGPVHLTPAL